MSRFVWVLQFLLGLFFLGMGIIHFVLPPGLPSNFDWMYDLTPWMHYVTGTAEILGGLGLILPGLTRIKTWLTPLAALGLMVVMGGAVVYHLGRGETRNVITNLVVAAVLGFVAYVRWRTHPIPARTPVGDSVGTPA